MSEQTKKSPIEWAECACDTLMAKFKAEELPPVGRFHYHQGVFLLGMQRCWEQDHNKKYFDYMKAWVDSLIRPDGSIVQYDPGQMDDIQPGILLYVIYEATGDSRYKIALDELVSNFPKLHCNKEGGYWHKDTTPDQMWLDGLFMGGPISTKYAAKLGADGFFDRVTLQAKLMAKYNRDEKTGLFYHGWDESRKAIWANPQTGTSPEFWGRAIGWYSTAVLDILDDLPVSHPDRQTLIDIDKNLIEPINRYQDKKTGLWYQVVDKGDRLDNWPEISCSCLFVYSIAKAVRKGLLDKKYLVSAQKGYEGVIHSLTFDGNGGVQIDGVCVGTGIGDYAFYAARPISVNDLHGVGAFIIMCDEINQLKKQ
jgi:unsaturated rhamnogalacturonyl hydrolase